VNANDTVESWGHECIAVISAAAMKVAVVVIITADVSPERISGIDI
jgi:hypothetical protein